MKYNYLKHLSEEFIQTFKYYFKKINKPKQLWIIGILIFYLRFRSGKYKLKGKYYFETLGDEKYTSDVLFYPSLQYQQQQQKQKQQQQENNSNNNTNGQQEGISPGRKKNGIKYNYSQEKISFCPQTQNPYNIDNLMEEQIKQQTRKISKQQSVNNFSEINQTQKSPKKVTQEIINQQQQKDLTIIFIPGFPGIIKLYDEFLDHLHKQLKQRVNIYALGYINLANNPKKDSRTFTLEQNARHKILFMQKLIKENPKQKFIIVAHSMGSFISLKIIQNFSNPIILKGYFLYPAVLDFTTSLVGKIAYLFYMKKKLFQLYRFCFWLNHKFIPKCLQRGATALFYGHKNAQIITEYSDYRNIFQFKTLFVDYMQYEEKGKKGQLILKKLDKCVYQFSKNDFLIPVKHADDLREKYPDVQCKVIPNITHQFMAGYSELQAYDTGNQILLDFPFLKQ